MENKNNNGKKIVDYRATWLCAKFEHKGDRYFSVINTNQRSSPMFKMVQSKHPSINFKHLGLPHPDLIWGLRKGGGDLSSKKIGPYETKTRKCV